MSRPRGDDGGQVKFKSHSRLSCERLNVSFQCLKMTKSVEIKNVMQLGMFAFDCALFRHRSYIATYTCTVDIYICLCVHGELNR